MITNFLYSGDQQISSTAQYILIQDGAAPRGSILANRKASVIGIRNWMKETKVHKFARIRKRRAKNEDTRRIRIILWLFLFFRFSAAFRIGGEWGFLSFWNLIVGYIFM